MKHTISKVFKFSSAHWLNIENHPCSNLHGHNYTAIVECSGELDERGMVFDLIDVKAAVKPIIKSLDHVCLNEVLDFETTAENIAAHIFAETKKVLGCVSSVTLWETDTCMVKVEE